MAYCLLFVEKIHQTKLSHTLEEKSGDAKDNSTRLTEEGGSGEKSYSRILGDGPKEDNTEWCMSTGRRGKNHGKRQPVYGTGQSASNICVASEPRRDLFVTGFGVDRTPEDIKNHMSYSDLRYVSVYKLNMTNNHCSSFKVTVPISQFDKSFNSDVWPRGIYVRIFHRRQKDAQSSS